MYTLTLRIWLTLLSMSFATITNAVNDKPDQLRLWLTISAQKRFIEVSWKNAPAQPGDNILLTKQQPRSFERVQLNRGIPLAAFDGGEGSGFLPLEGYTTTSTRPSVDVVNEGSGFDAGSGDHDSHNGSNSSKEQDYWVSSNGPSDIVAAIKPSVSAQWFTTGVPFDYALSEKVTIHTDCYGYWASYIDIKGNILAWTCIRAYPRWMNALNTTISNLRLRDLLLPATHDSGSYRPNFDPLLRETLVTKYALTQDDNIRSQLMHGVRYLDIRVGYYRSLPDKFFINHGITRQRPLAEVIDQVKDFVLATNEIVIFGLKEFPVGFGKGLGVHRLLVEFLRERFGDLIVHPSAGWRATLRDIWSRRQNVILAYDNSYIVNEFSQILFGSVEQRWGNVQSWTNLERHLRLVNEVDVSRYSSRPVADMAELTPDTWDVISDKYGGLRKMADQVNWRVSKLYHDELGERANIVAVDFILGTSLMDLAIDVNKRKTTL